jgi:quinol monooxygenase YgiN
MIIGTVRLLPRLDQRDAVVEVLRSIQGPVRAQPGCLACDVFEEQGPEPSVVLLERWENDEALAAHLRSESYRRILGAVELAGSQPDIRFERVSATEGLELVERIRSPGGRLEA